MKNSNGDLITSVCTNQWITLTSTTVSTNSGILAGDCNSSFTLLWSIGASSGEYMIQAGSSLISSPLVIKFISNGTYDITLAASNACSPPPGIKSKSICVAGPPFASYSISADPMNPASCSAVTISPVNSSVGADGCGTLNYTWSLTYNGGNCSNGPGTPIWVSGNASSFEPVIKLVDPGTYTLTLVVANSCGSSSHSETIVVKGPPKVAIIPPFGQFCTGNIFTFNMSVQNCFGTVLPGSQKWYLDSNPVVVGIGPTITLDMVLVGTHVLVAEAENECGTGYSGSYFFTVNYPPVAPTITPAGPLCENPPGGIALGLSAWEPGINYDWRLNSGNWNQGGPCPLLTMAVMPGEYFARAVDPVTGCATDAINSVWIEPLPMVYSISPFGVLCGCQDITLSNSQPGFEYLLFNTSNGLNVQTWVSPVYGGSHVFANICEPGTYVVQARDILNPHNTLCTVTMTGELTLVPNPLPRTVSPSGLACGSTTSTISVINPDAGVIYMLIRDGDYLNPMQSLAGTGTPVVFNSMNNIVPFNGPVFLPGTYTIRAICSTPSVICESIFGEVIVQPGPEVSAGADISACAGTPTSIPIIDATALNYNPASVLWTVMAGPGTIFPANSLNTIFTPGPNPGMNLLRLAVEGINSCAGFTKYDDKFVFIQPVPVLTSTLSPPPICSGTVFSYVPTSSTPGVNFTWSRAAVPGIVPPGPSSGIGNPYELLTITTMNPINVTYVYSLSANSCNNPIPYLVDVTVNPPLSGQVTLGDTFIGNGLADCWAHQTVTTGSPATFVVQSGGKATLIASDLIRLLPGTWIYQGGMFNAFVANNCIPCSSLKTFLPDPAYTKRVQNDNSNVDETNIGPCRIYPNPTNGKFRLEKIAGHFNPGTTIQVFALTGEVLVSSDISGGTVAVLSLENCKPGMYLIKVIEREGIWQGKIVLQ
ncbi:MAG: T9SS type A sorting domain-containing protein [Bacteroidetes bacterium]|nr:T9SS type A sorting domain-containing protein [Bacteroidota bacterium]